MTDRTEENFGDTPTALNVAIDKLLRRLVPLLLHFRITFPQLSERLKRAYVEIAETEEFALDNKRQTDARLSLLTGIHRKDIKRLRNQAREKDETTEAINVNTRLVARWISEPKYLTDEGAPLDLPLKGTAGEPDFESLVQDVLKKDMSPRVILDEWLNHGMASISDEKIVTLNKQAFIPKKDLKHKAFFFGHHVADHIAACTHNLREQEPALFDRGVYYDGLSNGSIKALTELVASQGMDTLKKFNESAISLKNEDMAKTEDKRRLTIGLYVYHEPDESEK